MARPRERTTGPVMVRARGYRLPMRRIARHVQLINRAVSGPAPPSTQSVVQRRSPTARTRRTTPRTSGAGFTATGSSRASRADPPAGYGRHTGRRSGRRIALRAVVSSLCASPGVERLSKASFAGGSTSPVRCVVLAPTLSCRTTGDGRPRHDRVVPAASPAPPRPRDSETAERLAVRVRADQSSAAVNPHSACWSRASTDSPTEYVVANRNSPTGTQPSYSGSA